MRLESRTLTAVIREDRTIRSATVRASVVTGMLSTTVVSPARSTSWCVCTCGSAERRGLACGPGRLTWIVPPAGRPAMLSTSAAVPRTATARGPAENSAARISARRGGSPETTSASSRYTPSLSRSHRRSRQSVLHLALGHARLAALRRGHDVVLGRADHPDERKRVHTAQCCRASNEVPKALSLACGHPCGAPVDRRPPRSL